ncbi:hypothetical protein OQJ19_11910 [Fluoribacter gormanii]|uniref:hypothetical protein n=1 Tax=Fluoribacter gormanii TaxID=464 RepID=UPI0022440E69|nr:hypothetical protein [Fluoribacter gormanii]MCW8471350.1 hypothetical protein [Fluoribacter gormanii]
MNGRKSHLELEIIREKSTELLSIIKGKNIYKERTQIGLFIKFTDSEYVESFKKGKLHLKNIGYFNKLEESSNFQIRKDELEGVAASFDSTGASFTMDGIPLNVIDRMNLRHSSSQNINIFCMTAIPRIKLHHSNEKITFSDKFIEFGDKAIIIKPQYTIKFMDKVKKALLRRKNLYACPDEPFIFTHVDYEKKDYSGRMGVFRKLNIYEWQSEWRIAIYRDLKKPNFKPITLSIGNIEDLCFTVDTVDLIKYGLGLTPSEN